MNRVLRAGVLALLVVYPVLVLLAATSTGLGISQDSVSYLATARSLARGAGLSTYTGEPLTLFPPGLPILLGTAQWAGVDALTAARLLNAGCLVGVVLGTYALGRLVGLHGWARLIPTGLVSLSAAFIGVFAWLWTEPLFILVVVAVLVLLLRALDRTAAWRLVVAVGVLASLASAVRYVGLTLLPVVAVGIWMAAHGQATRDRIVRTASALALGMALPAALVIRNLSAGAGPLGERSPGARTIQGAITATFEILGGFVVSPDATQLTVVVGVLLVGLSAVGVWLAFIRRDRAVLVLGVFLVVYGAAMAWSQAMTRLDAPSARLLGPALPALAVVAVVAGREVIGTMGEQARRWASTSPLARVRAVGGSAAGTILSVCTAVALVVIGMAAVVAGLRTAQSAPQGSLAEVVRASAMIGALPGATEGAGIASNDPWSVYLGLDRTPVVPLPPDPREWPAERVAADTRTLADAVASGRVGYAAVFDPGGDLLPIEDLGAQGIRLEVLATFADGVLYRLAPGG